MRKVIFILFFVSLKLFSSNSITPSHVYSEVNQIKKELDIIRDHFNVKGTSNFEPYNAKLQPRHAWQKTYEIMVKMNILRLAHDMPLIEPSNMQPVQRLNPFLTYEQTQRILTELAIFKTSLGIRKGVSKRQAFENKTPMDVYNLLHKVSLELDLINGKEFTPSYVFGEAMRIYNDITIIIRHLNITNETIPPKRVLDAQPKDAFATSIQILNKLNRLKIDIGLEVTDFTPFIRKDITPSDVFSLNQIVLSELQVIKAYIGLDNDITTSARSYSNKTPTDVNQMLGWSLRSIELIKTLDTRRGQ